MMLQDSKAFGSYSSNDIETAKKFYGDTLGIKYTEAMGNLILEFPPGITFFIYPKDDHQPATHTVLNLPVADVEKTVDELTSRGVRFEQYDFGEGNKTDEKGIMSGEGPTIAWFTDPAGNIISIISDDFEG